MKNKRLFIHFINQNGKDLGTFAAFESSKDHARLKENFNINGNSIFLTSQTIELARSITGLKLK